MASIEHGRNCESFAFDVVVDAEWEALRQGTVVAIHNLVDAAEVIESFNIDNKQEMK